MQIPAKAYAQAEEALEESAQALKRTIGVARKALRSVRQAQVNVVGVPVETSQPGGGTEHGSTHQDNGD